MKSPFILILLLVCLTHTKTPAVAADDIFATPTSTPTMVQRYPTAAAFLAATRSGEIPEMFRDRSQSAWDQLGQPLLNILQRQYGLGINRYDASAGVFGVMLQDITRHEFDRDDKYSLAEFQNYQQSMAVEGRNAFNKFAVEYIAAVKDYLVSKSVAETEKKHQEQLASVKAADEERMQNKQRALVDSEKQLKQAAADQQTADERHKAEEDIRQKKEVVDAKTASLKAEDDIRDAAMKTALAKAKKVRQDKLAEIVASPAYKTWEAALVVQQGEKMISNAQRVLDHDDAVQRESGVTNLAERRSAGEQMVAGKSLVETAFEIYKKQGGKAATPKEVVAGPDPAADYR